MHSDADIEVWITKYIGKLHGTPASSIDATATFDNLGLDSASAVALTGDLEDWLEIEIDPTLPYDYPTVRSLAGALAQEIAAR